MTGQDALDAQLLAYYGSQFDEQQRLTTRSVGGTLELVRARAVMQRWLAPGSRVLDVGGATGVHAAWLAAVGHDVLLLDPVPEQVARAAAVGGFEARVGDARSLDVPDNSADAVVLFGPLYHLVADADRRRALDEARRVLRPGGLLFAQGIGRLTALVDRFAGSPGAAQQPELDLLATGTWTNPGPGFPGGHFHTAQELADEVTSTGFEVVDLVGLEGPSLGALEWFGQDQQLLAAGNALVERLDELVVARPDLRAALADLSPHLVVVARLAEDAQGRSSRVNS